MKYKKDSRTNDPNWDKPLNKVLKGNTPVVRFKKLVAEAQVPKYQTEQDAGMDLHAVGFYNIPCGSSCVVSTGLAMSLPEGYEAQIRPRSGLAAKHAVTVLNAPGTIDSGFRGELKVILINHNKEKSFQIESGDRVAQMVISAIVHPKVVVATELDKTSRGDKGLGSTGVK